jgi:hypothetical protein
MLGAAGSNLWAATLGGAIWLSSVRGIACLSPLTGELFAQAPFRQAGSTTEVYWHVLYALEDGAGNSSSVDIAAVAPPSRCWGTGG